MSPHRQKQEPPVPRVHPSDMEPLHPQDSLPDLYRKPWRKLYPVRKLHAAGPALLGRGSVKLCAAPCCLVLIQFLWISPTQAGMQYQRLLSFGTPELVAEHPQAALLRTSDGWLYGTCA